MSRKNRNPNAYAVSDEEIWGEEEPLGYRKMGGAKDRKPRAEDPVKQARRQADTARWDAEQAAGALGGPRRR